MHSDGKTVDTVVLSYDRATDRMEIGGDVVSLDLMLDMLGRATRTMEKQYREASAIELKAKLVEMEQDARVAAALRKGV